MAARAGSTTALWSQNCGGDLPAEWNLTTTILSDGSDFQDYAWLSGNNTPYGDKELATLLPNDFGLYDMSGNVWEWVHDYYGNYSPAGVNNPVLMSGTERALRGGYRGNSADRMRSAKGIRTSQCIEVTMSDSGWSGIHHNELSSHNSW